MSPMNPENTHCPICLGPNHCCYGKTDSICWCSKAQFPQAIFELVPQKDRRKKCICPNCLQKFKDGKLTPHSTLR